MPELLLSIPVAALILLACHEAGRLICAPFRADDLALDRLDSLLLRLAVGFVGVEFVVTLLASIGVLKPAILWVLALALGVSAVVDGRRSLSDAGRSLGSVLRDSTRLPLNAILLTVTVVALLMDFALTCVPTTAWDALTYHYPLPAIWLQAGGFVPRFDICYSELPCASEMLFALAFGLGGISSDGTGIGALAANHLTWAAGLLACLGLLSIGRRLGASASNDSPLKQPWDSWTPGLIATAAFLSLPIMYVEEMEGGYIENFLVFLSLVMLALLLDFRTEKRPSQVLLIGILGGGLLASKHTSLLLDALVLLILIAWIVRLPAKQRPWRALLLAVLVCLVIPFPWYFKSNLQTGDPAWPFVSAMLHPDEPLPDIMYWSNPNVHRSLWGFIAYIPRLTWDESLVQIDFRLLSWYFLPLLPFAMFWSLYPRGCRTIGLIAWVLIMLIYLLAPGEPRYMLVAWALYAALGAWGLLHLLRRFPWLTRLVLPVLLIIPIGLSLVDRTKEVNRRVPTIIGIATVDEYFDKSYDIWPLLRFINEETEPDAGVVMIEPRILHVRRDYRIWYPFPTPYTETRYYRLNRNVLWQWRDQGIEYVVLTYGPNYRALALDAAYRRYRPEEYGAAPLFPELPAWVLRRATYAEQGLVLEEDGKPRMSWAALESRIREFDVRTIFLLDSLHASGYLEPVFVDEKAGAVFRVIQPGSNRR